MEPLLIQIPKKAGEPALYELVKAIDYGMLTPPEIKIMEYPKLFIIDGIPSKEYRDVITDFFDKKNIKHF